MLAGLCHVVYHQSWVFIDRSSSSSKGSWGLDYVRSIPSRPNKVKRFQYKSKEVSFANCAFEKICCCWNPLVNCRYFIPSQSHLWLQWLARVANTVRVPGLRGSSSAWFLLITFIQSFEVKQWLHQERVGVRGLFIRYLWVADHYDYTRQWIT